MASESRIASASSALSLGAAESTTMLNVKTRKSFMVVEEHIETKKMIPEDHESHSDLEDDEDDVPMVVTCGTLILRTQGNEINSPVQERKIQNEQIDKMKDNTSNKENIQQDRVEQKKKAPDALLGKSLAKKLKKERNPEKCAALKRNAQSLMENPAAVQNILDSAKFEKKNISKPAIETDIDTPAEMEANSEIKVSENIAEHKSSLSSVENLFPDFSASVMKFQDAIENFSNAIFHDAFDSMIVPLDADTPKDIQPMDTSEEKLKEIIESPVIEKFCELQGSNTKEVISKQEEIIEEPFVCENALLLTRSTESSNNQVIETPQVANFCELQGSNTKKVLSQRQEVVEEPFVVEIAPLLTRSTESSNNQVVETPQVENFCELQGSNTKEVFSQQQEVIEEPFVCENAPLLTRSTESSNNHVIEPPQVAKFHELQRTNTEEVFTQQQEVIEEPIGCENSKLPTKSTVRSNNQVIEPPQVAKFTELQGTYTKDILTQQREVMEEPFVCENAPLLTKGTERSKNQVIEPPQLAKFCELQGTNTKVLTQQEEVIEEPFVCEQAYTCIGGQVTESRMNPDHQTEVKELENIIEVKSSPSSDKHDWDEDKEAGEPCVSDSHIKTDSSVNSKEKTLINQASLHDEIHAIKLDISEAKDNIDNKTLFVKNVEPIYVKDEVISIANKPKSSEETKELVTSIDTHNSEIEIPEKGQEVINLIKKRFDEVLAKGKDMVKTSVSDGKENVELIEETCMETTSYSVGTDDMPIAVTEKVIDIKRHSSVIEESTRDPTILDILCTSIDEDIAMNVEFENSSAQNKCAKMSNADDDLASSVKNQDQINVNAAQQTVETASTATENAEPTIDPSINIKDVTESASENSEPGGSCSNIIPNISITNPEDDTTEKSRDVSWVSIPIIRGHSDSEALSSNSVSIQEMSDTEVFDEERAVSPIVQEFDEAKQKKKKSSVPTKSNIKFEDVTDKASSEIPQGVTGQKNINNTTSMKIPDLHLGFSRNITDDSEKGEDLIMIDKENICLEAPLHEVNDDFVCVQIIDVQETEREPDCLNSAPETNSSANSNIPLQKSGVLQDKSQGRPSPSIELEKEIDLTILEGIQNENTDAKLDITLTGKQEVVEDTNSGNLINDVISAVKDTLVTESANLSDENEHFKNVHTNGNIKTENLPNIDAINPEVTDCIDELIESVVKAEKETDDRLMETIPKESESVIETVEADKAAVHEDKISNIFTEEEPNDVAETQEVLLTNLKTEYESSGNSIENITSPEMIPSQEIFNSSEHLYNVKSEITSAVELEQEEKCYFKAAVEPFSSKNNMEESRTNQVTKVDEVIEDKNSISDNDLKPSNELEEVTSNRSAEALLVSDEVKIDSKDSMDRIEEECIVDPVVPSVNSVNHIVAPTNGKVTNDESSRTTTQEESLIETDTDEIRSDELEFKLAKEESVTNLPAESHDNNKNLNEIKEAVEILQDNYKVTTNESSRTTTQEEPLITTDTDEIRSDELECTLNLAKEESVTNLPSESYDNNKTLNEIKDAVESVQDESSIKSVQEHTNSNNIVEEVLSHETPSLVVEHSLNLEKDIKKDSEINELAAITTRVSENDKGNVEVTKTDSQTIIEDQKPKENLNLQEENNQATQELLAVTSKMVESSSVESIEVLEKCKSICARETTNTTIAAASQEFIVDSIKTEAGQDLTGSLCQPVKVQEQPSSSASLIQPWMKAFVLVLTGAVLLTYFMTLSYPENDCEGHGNDDEKLARGGCALDGYISLSRL